MPKGITDALFYDEEAKELSKALGKRKTGKGDDKYAGAISPPPRYDKENPRVIVIVKPYRKKSDDLCDSKRNEKGRTSKNRDNVSGKKRKKKRRASNGES